MSVQNLIIYKFTTLYSILEELGLDLNFNITYADNEKSLKEYSKNLSNYMVISNKHDNSNNSHKFKLYIQNLRNNKI